MVKQFIQNFREAFWVPVFGQLNTMHWGFRLVR